MINQMKLIWSLSGGPVLFLHINWNKHGFVNTDIAMFMFTRYISCYINNDRNRMEKCNLQKGGICLILFENFQNMAGF